MEEKLKQAEREEYDRKRKEEARRRASFLLQPLSDEDRLFVNKFIYETEEEGEKDKEVIAKIGTDTIQCGSIKTLQPTVWINDETIHYYFILQR